MFIPMAAAEGAAEFHGTSKSTTETVVGTVTVYAPGKRIEVMTGEKKMHSFSLDDRDITYSVDGYVAVGERVTVTDQWGDDKVHRITVKLGGSSSAFRASTIAGIQVDPEARAGPDGAFES